MDEPLEAHWDWEFDDRGSSPTSTAMVRMDRDQVGSGTLMGLTWMARGQGTDWTGRAYWDGHVIRTCSGHGTRREAERAVEEVFRQLLSGAIEHPGRGSKLRQDLAERLLAGRQRDDDD